MVLPEMKKASSCDRSEIAFATASVVVSCIEGFFDLARSIIFFEPGIFASAAVSVTPAMIALQVMPYGPNSNVN